MVELTENPPIEFKCLQVKQPLGSFYVGVMPHADLVAISWADIRRLESGDERREVEIYTGIQRELSSDRVKQLGKYVHLVDATFPSSIILHIEEDDIRFDSDRGVLIIPHRDNIAKILDGQHRIAGLEQFEGNAGAFDAIVTVFVGMELEDQALVFATLNETQTKVNKSLVSDLFAFAKHRSPQRTAHLVVRALNEKDGSPFKDKIKILGTANDSEKETITQSTFSQSLIKLFSADPMTDRDLYKRDKTPEEYVGVELEKRPLRNLFIAEDDGAIANIIWEYFAAVRNKWPNAWNNVQPELILNRSTGFIALMRLFQPMYVSFGKIGTVVKREEYGPLFERISLTDNELNRQTFLPGTGGQAALFRRMKKDVWGDLD